PRPADRGARRRGPHRFCRGAEPRELGRVLPDPDRSASAQRGGRDRRAARRTGRGRQPSLRPADSRPALRSHRRHNTRERHRDRRAALVATRGSGRRRRGDIRLRRHLPRDAGHREARRAVRASVTGRDAEPPNALNLTFADLGTGALRAALPLAIWGIGAAGYAAAKRDGRALASARWSALITLLLVVLAALAMVGALVTHDFSIAYVARNNALETPLFFTVISLWAALEGSILLWTAILAGATAYVAWRGTPALPRLATTALAVLFAMLAFFLILVTTPAADPFVRSEIVPLNGNGPNPLLQNHPLMALHPPLLYLGYVLFSVPFAYAIASLILGEGGDRWLVATRRFALVSWALLGVGIVAGSWWSYAVLGWGGYWAWDPVENAAIMPWLTATAYLHSVMVEEKRRLLRTWNLSLVITTFALTILGTFLTRSGVVNSVHAFTQSAIGPLLLGYFVAVVVLSIGLMLWRMPRLADQGGLGAPLSREAIFLFQNVVFVAATLTVLLGTL